MLQQTQVSTVIPFYLKWMGAFPNFQALASADESRVMAYWQGLGYYRRARMLQEASRFVVKNGIPPPVASDWRSVPGIGPYTAGAVTSIAFGAAEALVDGNVSRVYSRLVADPSVGPRLEKNAWLWARNNLDRSSPGEWNQALMELGATICTPKNPICCKCPLSDECQAFSTGSMSSFPSPKPRPSMIDVAQTTVIPIFGSQFGIEQIPKGEWWESLWRFPTVRVREGVVAEADPHLKFLGSVRHTVTNHKVRLDVYRELRDRMSPALTWVDRPGLESLAMPTPQRKALKLLLDRQPDLEL